MKRSGFIKLSVYVFILVCWFLSTKPVRAQIEAYSDSEAYTKSEYGVLLYTMNRDKFFKQKNHIAQTLDSLNQVYKDHDELDLYRRFAEFYIEMYYSSGVLENIEDDFYEIIAESGKQHSIVSPLIFRVMLVYYKSIKQSDKLLELLELIKNNPSYLKLSDTYDFTSTIYYDTFQYNKAIEAYKAQIEIHDRLAYKASLRNNIGLAYMHLNEPDKAIKHYKQAYYTVNKIIEDSLSVNPDYNGEQYLRNLIRGNLEEAMQKRVDIDDKIEELDLHVKNVLEKEYYLDVEVLFEQAKLYANAERYEESNLLLDSVEVNLMRGIRMPNLHSKIKKQKAFNNLKLGHVEAALKNISEDTVEYINEQLHKNIHNYYNKAYQEEKSIIENDVKDISKQRQTAIWFLICVICISAGVYLFILKRKRHAEHKTKLTQEELNQVKSESELYFKESNHRIMNNIQLINDLTALDYWDNESFDIDAFQSKMNSLADIHELLYKSSSYDSVSVQQYLENLVGYMANVGTDDLSIKVHANPELHISPDQLKYLGLLTVELITNSLKHGLKDIKEKYITIECKGSTKDRWVFTYTDNGVFNAEEFSNSTGYGNQLIFQLIELLHAKYNIADSSHFSLQVTYTT